MNWYHSLILFGTLLNIHLSLTYIVQPPINFIAEDVDQQIDQGSNGNSVLIPRPPIFPHLDTGNHHECYRLCTIRETPKTCYYHFNIEWYTSLSKACFDCPFYGTDCEKPDCVVANGRRRTITVINRQMPGPTIQVCQNDRIIVDLENNLLSSGTTLHWHGMHQRNTPYMDGAPYVTQCPIQPENTFRYDFQASEAGTHFYHSHLGLQRADGAFGNFIVRRPRAVDPQREHFDMDLPEHVIILSDWTDQPAMTAFIDHYHSSGSNRPQSMLINGKGVFNVTADDRLIRTKPAEFEVIRGNRYRFRLINAEFSACPMELSVEGHSLTAIAVDGSDIQPVIVSAIVSFAGERFDFVINANEAVDSYWIKVRSLLACSGPDNELRQIAILRYKGAANLEPTQEPNWAPVTGMVLNRPNLGEESDTTISISKTRSVLAFDARLRRVPDYKFFIRYDLYGKNNSMFHRDPYFFNQVNDAGLQVFSPQFNHISMRLPKSPLLSARPSSDKFCNATTINDTCIQNFCQCPHVVTVRRNAVVELILLDEGKDFSANHPFHLHGYAFRVLSQFKLNNSTTAEEVEKMDRMGLLQRNFVNAPIKDTVAVPDGGYAIIRFYTDNPGYWLFHCHIEFHAEIGMALVFKVGEHEDMVPVPGDFPTCGDFGVTGV